MPGRNILVTLSLAGLLSVFNFHELSIKQIRVPKGSESWFQALLRLVVIQHRFSFSCQATFFAS